MAQAVDCSDPLRRAGEFEDQSKEWMAAHFELWHSTASPPDWCEPGCGAPIYPRARMLPMPRALV